MKTVNPTAAEIASHIHNAGKYPVKWVGDHISTVGYLIKREGNEFDFLFIDDNSGYKCAICFRNLLDHPRLRLHPDLSK